VFSDEHLPWRRQRPDRDGARRDLLHGSRGTTILEHDARSPGAILADPGLTSLLDLTQPVAVLLVACTAGRGSG
jgi:S-adenosyl methyltransferase